MSMTKPCKSGTVERIGVAGVGAIGGAVCRALLAEPGLPGLELVAVADRRPPDLPVPVLDFAGLAEVADLVVECLPAAAVPDLAAAVLGRGKTLMLVTSAALLLYPDIRRQAEAGGGRILIPSGALAGIDGVRALANLGILEARIRSTKPPRAYTGAPHVVAEAIDLDAVHEPLLLFEGSATDAARAFPANVNVAATLSLAGVGPELTRVEVWADPFATGNTHEIRVDSELCTLRATVTSQPDPANPKSSVLAAQSAIAALRSRTAAIALV
ncbi:MAG: DUF108 domain-containing protein [Alphaproteobacteria bacterium]|jgi:aspartate dehydrogenase|nr:DUF108 domain-containing protein [Alphaproteobacteria bacterium]